MFWGLIMEPQRRYTQKVKKAFHISMASLDVSTSSEEPAQVMVGFEGRNYLLCTLRKPDMLQCPLDLNFEVGDELSLAANGKCHVHLTGYLIEVPDDLLSEDDEEDEVEEEEISQEKEVKKKNKKRNKLDIQNGPPVKKPKANIEITQEDSEEDDDSDEEDSDVNVKDLLDNTLESDEDDDTFVSDDADDGEEQSEEDDDDQLEDEEEEESSLSEADTDEEVVPISNSKPKMNGTPKKLEVSTPNKQKEKKDKKNELKKQQTKPEGKTPNKENQSPKAKESKKTLQNGLIIEDLKEGQGQPAKPGKVVTVYYEGRLKINNKVFDSTKQGAGFSFRLGGGEVIKGWDTGLLGMKTGGKRRITCPPNMAYGVKGSPPAIPANSTLVFEVELKKIR